MALVGSEGVILRVEPPFPSNHLPKAWQCPECGLQCAISQDVQAQIEERPRMPGF